jgi:thioredoxin 1
MVTPVLEQIAGEREITIAKVNTDINPVSSGRFGIRGIPALLLFRDGEMVDRMTGAMPKNGMDAWLDRHMA